MNDNLPLYHVIDVSDNSVKFESISFKDCANFAGLKIQSAYKALRIGSTSLKGYKLIRARNGYTLPQGRRLKKDYARLYCIYDNKMRGILVFQSISMIKCAQYLKLSRATLWSALYRKSLIKKRYNIDYIKVNASERYALDRR